MEIHSIINRTVCPFCGCYLPSLDEAMAGGIGTVADTLTIGHFARLKARMDHESHALFMEKKWAEMEPGGVNCPPSEDALT